MDRVKEGSMLGAKVGWAVGLSFMQSFDFNEIVSRGRFMTWANAFLKTSLSLSLRLHPLVEFMNIVPLNAMTVLGAYAEVGL